LRHPRRHAGPEGHARLVAPDEDVLDPESGAQYPEPRHVEQRLGLHGKRTEAFPKFRAKPINLIRRLRSRQSAVQIELGVVIAHEGVRQVSRPVEHYFGGWLVLTAALAAERLHGLLEPPEVKVES